MTGLTPGMHGYPRGSGPPLGELPDTSPAPMLFLKAERPGEASGFSRRAPPTLLAEHQQEASWPTGCLTLPWSLISLHCLGALSMYCHAPLCTWNCLWSIPGASSRVGALCISNGTDLYKAPTMCWLLIQALYLNCLTGLYQQYYDKTLTITTL